MKIIKILITLSLANIMVGQEKIDLKSFNESISFTKDKTLSNSIRTANSSEYTFRVENRHLKADYKFTDWMLNGYTKKENAIERRFNYSIPLDSLESIEVKISKYRTTCDTCYITSANLDIKTINSMNNIRGISDGYSSEISMLTIPINQIRDTSKFIKLSNHLNSLRNNELSTIPTCHIDSIQFAKGYPIWFGIKSKNLEEPLLLDSKPITGINQFIQLQTLIEELELTALTLCIVINRSNEVTNITIFEFEAGKVYEEKFKEMNPEERKMMLDALGILSEEDKNKIEDVIYQQNWTSGKCKGELVQSLLWIEYMKTN